MKKLTKIDVNPKSIAPQAENIGEYRANQELGIKQFYEGKSPPISYEVVGNIIGEIEKGASVLMDRYYRSDADGELIEMRGIFRSSIVQNIEESDDVTYITTDNSLYKIEDFEH